MKYNMSDDEENGFRGHEDMRVDLPLSYPKIKIPQLFITEHLYETDEFEREENGKFKMKKVAHKSRNGKITYKMEKVPIVKMGWFLIDRGNKVINKTRNISTRHGHKLLDLQVSKVNKIEEPHHYIPRLAEFPRMEDRRTIYNYLTHLHPNEIMNFPHNKTRGLPPILPKNWKHHNLGALPKGYKPKKESDSDSESESDREVSHQDIFGSDSESDEETPKKKSPPKKTKKVIPVQLESDSESEKEEQGAGGGAGGGKGRGRPRKHMTTEEAYKAKIKSNKDKRAERAKEARREKIKEKLAKGEKLTKKERELHEAEGGAIEDPCWKGYEMKGMKMKKGKKVPNCIPKGGTLKSSVAKGNEGIDFEDIKWGTFKALYNRFMKNNPTFKDKIEDLEHFAHFVVANPDKFSKVAHKKAQFYVNILEHKTEGGKLSKIGQTLNKIFNPTKNGFVNKNKVNYSNDTITNNDFK